MAKSKVMSLLFHIRRSAGTGPTVRDESMGSELEED